MIFFKKMFGVRWQVLAAVWIVVVQPGAARGMDNETAMLSDMAWDKLMKSAYKGSLFPTFGFDIQIITEGVDNFPIEKQLSNFIPFDMDFTIITCIGWTGDKLTIELKDEEDYGDFLTGIALVFYQNQVKPFWGTVFSSSSGDSFNITIPVTPPGVVVLLATGYWTPSIGENPYKYEINLSFPQ